MKVILYLLATVSLFSCNSETLVISVGDAFQGDAYLYNTTTFKIDTLQSIKGRYTFSSGELDGPTLYYLMFTDINTVHRPIYLLLSDQKTHIKFDSIIAVKENTQDIKKAYPNRPSFPADPNNMEAFYFFHDLWMRFYNEVQNPQNSLDKRMKLYSSFLSTSEEIITRNRENMSAALIIDYLIRNNLIQLEKIQTLYSYLSSEAQESHIGESIQAEVGMASGTVAPDFTFKDNHGDHYSLKKLKGNKVLLHFWSSTCAPCLYEIPDLLTIAEENKDVIILNISLDTDSTSWLSRMDLMGITSMINFCDFKGFYGKIASDYKIKSLPANYLIDENGLIITKKESLVELADLL